MSKMKQVLRSILFVLMVMGTLPAAEKSSLTLECAQDNVTVYLNNKLYDTISGNVTFEDLAPGIYIIKVIKEGYQSKGRIINLKSNTQQTIRIELIKKDDQQYKDQDNKKLVFSHYMQWFQHREYRGETLFKHWEWYGRGDQHNPLIIKSSGFRDIASIYNPLIGPYDSEDQDIMEYHILTAKAAGIDGFIVDWYGQENYIDNAFRLLLSIAQKYDFMAGICYEEKLAFPGYKNPQNRDEALQFALSDFKYIIDNYGGKENYLQYNDSPLLLMFLSSGNWKGFGNKIFNKEETIRIIDFLNKYNWTFVRQHLWMDFKQLRAGFAWIGGDDYNDWFYRSARNYKAAGTLDLVIGVVNPGFNDSGVWGWGTEPRITLRQNGDLYAAYWDMIYENDPEIVQIATWNDFQEGSVIEPTVEDKFFYIDRTEEYITRYKKSKKDLHDNTIPFKIFQLRKYIKKYPFTKQKIFNEQLNNIALNLFKKPYDQVLGKLNSMAEELSYTFADHYHAQNEYPVYTDHVNDQLITKIFKSPDNLALNSKVTASYEDTVSAVYSIDGNINTKWLSAYHDYEWYEIDLGKTTKVCCVMIDWAAAYGKEYFIKISRDKNNWKTIYKQIEGLGDFEIIEFEPIECQYVRFEGIKPATHMGYSFWEIGVFNTYPDI